jgi:hypothetical protein
MAAVKRWDFTETHELVKAAFGTSQFRLARESLRSLVDRQDYARYHFREMTRLTKEFERRHLKNDSLMKIYAQNGESKLVAFQRYIVKASAHATASVQCIHALPDILANAVYFVCGQNLQSKSLLERNITLPRVVGIIKTDLRFSSLVPLLTKAQSGTRWGYLSELTNLSKHRSVVRASLNEDLTGMRKNHRELQFQAFERESKYLPGIAVLSLIETEYERLANLIVDIGLEVNTCLRKIEN